MLILVLIGALFVAELSDGMTMFPSGIRKKYTWLSRNVETLQWRYRPEVSPASGSSGVQTNFRYPATPR
jgi:hypothetical protein